MTTKDCKAQVGQTRVDGLGAKFAIRDRRPMIGPGDSPGMRSGTEFDVAYDDGLTRWLSDTILDSFTTYVSGPKRYDADLLTALRIGSALKDAPPEVNQLALYAALRGFRKRLAPIGSEIHLFMMKTISAYVAALPKSA